MATASTIDTDREGITEIIQHYLDGAKSGRGDDMKPAFHEDPIIFGYIGPNLFAGPIQKLFDWNDENGPAIELRPRVKNIDVAGTVATVRFELATGPAIASPIPLHF